MSAEPRFDPDDMARRGRIGGLTTSSRHDTKANTAPARKAFLSRFEREVDPDGSLPEAERQRRAEAAKKAHMLKLAHASAKARRKDASDRKGQPVAA